MNDEVKEALDMLVKYGTDYANEMYGDIAVDILFNVKWAKKVLRKALEEK